MTIKLSSHGAWVEYTSVVEFQLSLHGFPRQPDHFFSGMSNRVEHQKQNQPAIEKWPFGFVFGIQLGRWQRLALIKTKNNKKEKKNT